MPSLAFWVSPIQFEIAPTPTLARSSRIMPLIMVAALPMRRVCLTMAYGNNLWTFSNNFNR